MKISASIYSNKERALESLVAELEQCGVDFIHVDCNDDLGVEDAIARCRAISRLPIDLHIISPEPEKFYPMIQRHGVEMVTLQHEDLGGRMPSFPYLGCEWGLAITTGTPNSAFAQYAAHCAFILFMTTTPGQSGGAFQRENFRKIRAFRHEFPGTRIHVDGGVNAEISFVLRNLGVYSAVSGSYLVNAESVPSALLKLLVQKTHNHLRVEDVMHSIEELPVLPLLGLDAHALLNAIEAGRTGYCLVTGPGGRLEGVVTNADIRRGLIAHMAGSNGSAPTLPPAHQLLNRHPKTIHPHTTISEMLQAVKGFPFLVQFLPVVDDAGHLVGAINFNQLILGEL